MKGSVTEVGFRWGTSSENLSNTATGTLNGTSFSASLSGLEAGTTYYYQAYAKVQGTGDKSSSVQTFTGDVNQFTTSSEKIGLLELPAQKSGYIHNGFRSGKTRNYNYCYDTGHYASLWVAYPLTKSHTEGSASTSSWKYYPNISSDC
ncbi:MAG: fibronectin type III domain-containing protein, partial [Bacteroidales bacterium]|nr:fibronectin type III domain-containing protein [Bacteroidales bacterium]